MMMKVVYMAVMTFFAVPPGEYLNARVFQNYDGSVKTFNSEKECLKFTKDFASRVDPKPGELIQYQCVSIRAKL